MEPWIKLSPICQVCKNTMTMGKNAMFAIINPHTGRVLFSGDEDTVRRRFDNLIYEIPKLQPLLELFELTNEGWEESEF